MLAGVGVSNLGRRSVGKVKFMRFAWFTKQDRRPQVTSMPPE